MFGLPGREAAPVLGPVGPGERGTPITGRVRNLAHASTMIHSSAMQGTPSAPFLVFVGIAALLVITPGADMAARAELRRVSLMVAPVA